MAFSVNVPALYGLPAMLGRRRHDFAVGRSYLRESTHLRWDGGLINLLLRAHEHTIQEIDDYLGRAGDTYALGYATAIRQAADSYRAVDGTAAARLDATLTGRVFPSVPDRPADPGLGPEIFAVGENNFAAGYVPPLDYLPTHPYRPAWSDLVSPAGLARTLVYEAARLAHHLGIGPPARDPYDAFCLPLIGDWAGLMRCADAFTCVASVLSAERAQLRRGAGALWRVWTGHAAGNAEDALLRFADDLTPAEAALIRIAEGYQHVADGVQAKSDALGVVVTGLIDIASEVAVIAATDGLALIRLAKPLLESLVELFTTGTRLVEALTEMIRHGGEYTSREALALSVLVDAHYGPPLPDDRPELPLDLVYSQN